MNKHIFENIIFSLIFQTLLKETTELVICIWVKRRKAIGRRESQEKAEGG